MKTALASQQERQALQTLPVDLAFSTLLLGIALLRAEAVLIWSISDTCSGYAVCQNDRSAGLPSRVQGNKKSDGTHHPIQMKLREQI